MDQRQKEGSRVTTSELDKQIFSVLKCDHEYTANVKNSMFNLGLEVCSDKPQDEFERAFHVARYDVLDFSLLRGYISPEDIPKRRK